MRRYTRRVSRDPQGECSRDQLRSIVNRGRSDFINRCSRNDGRQGRRTEKERYVREYARFTRGWICRARSSAREDEGHEGKVRERGGKRTFSDHRIIPMTGSDSCPSDDRSRSDEDKSGRTGILRKRAGGNGERGGGGGENNAAENKSDSAALSFSVILRQTTERQASLPFVRQTLLVAA